MAARSGANRFGMSRVPHTGNPTCNRVAETRSGSNRAGPSTAGRSQGDMMTGKAHKARRPGTRAVVASIVAAGALAVVDAPASAATSATFSNGVLTVSGDGANNSIVIGRDAAGRILVNGGAVAAVGGTPTVANTSLIRVSGLAGNDQITMNEANGALPAARLFGGQ